VVLTLTLALTLTPTLTLAPIPSPGRYAIYFYSDDLATTVVRIVW